MKLSLKLEDYGCIFSQNEWLEMKSISLYIIFYVLLIDFGENVKTNEG